MNAVFRCLLCRWFMLVLTAGALVHAGSDACALQTAPANSTAPVTFDDVMKLLSLGIDEDAILKRLEKSPSTFVLSDAQVARLKAAGATGNLLAALSGTRPMSAQAGEMITDIAIILDCSGSMRETTSGGQTKMAVARTVVSDLVRKIPDGMNVTFVLYGHEAYGPADDPRNCQAVKVARPLQAIDDAGKNALASTIAGLNPTGATPIALAMRTAGAELAKNGAFCGMVLITDGLETCQGNPAAEAETLVSSLKLSFGVNVIGFVVGQDSASLQEIAQRGKGKYYDANSAEEFSEAVQQLRAELEQRVAPLEQRENRKYAAAGQAVSPGAFIADAAAIEPGEYSGKLAFMEADYYSIPVRTGQEIRAIGIIQKTPYIGYNHTHNQTFAITVYKQDLSVAAREVQVVAGSPNAPASVRATWLADYDGLAYIALSASDNHDAGEGYGEPVAAYEPPQPEPSAYTLRVRRDGDAGPVIPVPRLEVAAGSGFDGAGELSLPGMASTDLKLGEVIFYRVPAEKGAHMQIAVAGQKPWHQGFNYRTAFRYVLTVYDDDQVQVAQQQFEISKNPPDAHSLVMDYTVELGGSVWLTVSCENAGEGVYQPEGGPLPGRVAVQITPAAGGSEVDQGGGQSP